MRADEQTLAKHITLTKPEDFGKLLETKELSSDADKAVNWRGAVPSGRSDCLACARLR